MRLIHFVNALLILALAGCAASLDFALPKDEELQLLIYEKGAVDKQCVISANGPTHEALASWLAANKSDWETTPATYAPGRLIQGSKFSINVQEPQIIVSHAGGQFVRAYVPSEFAFLSCEAGV